MALEYISLVRDISSPIHVRSVESTPYLPPLSIGVRNVLSSGPLERQKKQDFSLASNIFQYDELWTKNVS